MRYVLGVWLGWQPQRYQFSWHILTGPTQRLHPRDEEPWAVANSVELKDDVQTDHRQDDERNDDDEAEDEYHDDEPSPLPDLTWGKGAEAGSQRVQQLEEGQRHITIVRRVRFRPLRWVGLADRCLILSLLRLEYYPPRHRQTGRDRAKIRIRPGVIFRVKITPQTATDSDSVLLEYLLESRRF